MQKKIRDVEWFQVEDRLNKIVQTNFTNHGYTCYLAGMGGLSKSIYVNLKSNEDLELIKLDLFNSNNIGYKILSIIFSSYWGVLKIKNLALLNTILEKIADQSMAELYLFDEIYENSFRDFINDVKTPMDISAFIEQIPNYFLYQIDTDSYESKTGIVEAMSWGKDCSQEVTDIVELEFFR